MRFCPGVVYCILALLMWGCGGGATKDCPDSDGDGVTDAECGGVDCNDSNAQVNPHATEVCNNGVDDDCNAGTPDTFDADGDGDACDVDCDDADPLVGPSRPEVCANGTDDDCNPDTPDVFDGDADGDSCEVDCNDSDAAVGPSQAEVECNQVDDDCNPATEDAEDADADGWPACGGDCEDSDPDVNPGAAEQCGNGVDDDCNPDTADVFDGDTDGDMCDVDCDDSDPLVGPSLAEVCANGVDDDCDPGTADVFDSDLDGEMCDLDCDDTNPDVHSGQSEVCANGTDDDCDPATPDVFDGDADGHACDVDCDDADPGVGAAEPEVCTGGLDEDCDGDIDCLDDDCQNVPPCLDCGDGQLQVDEDCDDANVCQYDGCNGCVLEQAVVLTSLDLEARAGFDLDNADGDDNIYTGVDNEFNLGIMYQFLIDMFVNNVINGYIESGSIIHVFTLGDLDNVPFDGTGTPGYEDDPEIVVTGYVGTDPDCPANPSPVPWIDPANIPWSLYSDSDFFSGCDPLAMVDDTYDSANGIYPANTDPAQPPAPFIHVHAPWISINPTSGWVGSLEFYNVYIEGSVINDGSVITGIQDGEIGAILPASSLYSITVGSAQCPTALHAILAYVGQPDQDTEGNGTRDRINYTCSGFCGSACMSDTVTITGCTDDETGEVIPGSDCVLDPRIRDGYSAGFTFTALSVHITGQVSGATYCP